MHLIVRKIPKQNGIAKWKNWTIVEITQSMLSEKGLSNDLWAEAIETSIHLLNISPTKTIHNKTPYDNVSFLRIFGSVAYALIHSDDRAKIDKKSKKCIFVGYSDEIKDYQLFNSTKRCFWWKAEPSQHLTFLENELRSNPSNENMLSPSSSTQRTPSSDLNDPGNNTPPQKVRSLREIYESCNFALMDTKPTYYEETYRKEERRIYERRNCINWEE
jgi:hypothetical protein